MESGTNNSSQANPNISIQTGHSQQVEPLIVGNANTITRVLIFGFSWCSSPRAGSFGGLRLFRRKSFSSRMLWLTRFIQSRKENNLCLQYLETQGKPPPQKGSILESPSVELRVLPGVGWLRLTLEPPSPLIRINPLVRERKMPRKYQPGLESTKSWLKSHGKGEIEEVLEKSGLSTQKARMILKSTVKSNSSFTLRQT